MVHLIFKKSERELRERAFEEAPPGFRQGDNIDGYARGFEEADELTRSRGRDNPNRKGILTDDGGKAEKELRDRTLRSFGQNPDHHQWE